MLELIPSAVMQVVLSWYLATGGPMYNGEMPHPGAAACSWNIPINTRLVLPAGDVVVCKDRGMLGSTGHVDVFVNDHEEGRRLITFYGEETTVRVLGDLVTEPMPISGAEARMLLFGSPVDDRSESRKLLQDGEKEAALQGHLQKVLTACGWRWFHDNDPRRNNPGWPDLICVRERDRWSENGTPNYPFVLFLELKTRKGKLRKEQMEMWTIFEDIHAHSAEVYFAVVRPSNLAEVEAWIKGRAG